MEDNTEEERLLGVSLTGIMDCNTNGNKIYLSDFNNMRRKAVEQIKMGKVT